MAATSDGTGQRASDGVLATKLYAPRPAPGYVPRRRLLDRLDEGLRRALTLVCAPAGFGKTALLAEWIQSRPAAWVSLDEQDNDPVRFWRHVAAALDGVRPGVADVISPLLSSPVPASTDSLVTLLINELAADPSELRLVLDDYHVIDAHPVHGSVAFLIEHQPPGLHVAIASRADPLLPLARLRASGQLAELRATDLRFTTEEATALLREALGPELGDDDVSALTARTEGWAAGLQLAALSLRDHTDVTQFVATFSGSHRYVLDYLAEEVLERQPDRLRSFLLETSVLDRLSGSLCDAVSGSTDGQALLQAIERANLFLVPLDEQRMWWRYHHLFADLLRARLEQERPDDVPRLHHNAAAWHEQHGSIDDAVRHALASGDAIWAARIVECHADELLLGGEGTTLHRWLEALPAELTDTRARLLLARTRFASSDELDALFDAAERSQAAAASEPYEASVGRGASRFTNVAAMVAIGRAHVAYLRGDADATLAFASRALAEVAVDEWMLDSLARSHSGAAQWLRGQVEEAEHDLRSSIEWWHAHDVHDMVTLWLQYLGRIQFARGRLDDASETFGQALVGGETRRRPALPAMAAGLVGLAAVAYERDDIDTALNHSTEGVALCRQFVVTDSLATGLATLAWSHRVLGDVDAALEAMAEAERVADPSPADLLNPIPAQQARLMLALGDLAAAARWTAERRLTSTDEPNYLHEPAYLVLARVLLAQQHADDALRLLDRLKVDATAQGRIGSVIEILALRALALAANRDEANAIAALTETLALAHPQGYVRVFADEGAPMAELVGALIASQRSNRAGTPVIPVGYLGRLVRALDKGTPTPAAAVHLSAVPGLISGLSVRELEVLRLIAAGKPNREIADTLYVSTHTVKKHVTHILDKLGASNRTEVTARARDLGLVR